MTLTLAEKQFYDDLLWMRRHLMAKATGNFRLQEEIRARYDRMHAAFHEQGFKFAHGQDD